MLNAYMNAFYSVVKETQVDTGYELPEPVESYVVLLLANNIDKPNFFPERSFAEAYMKLKRPAGYSAKELGDACLLVSGAFPTYGKKHGLSRSYYQNIGITSYDLVAESLHIELFKTLSNHFVFISDFITVVTSPESPSPYLYR